MTLEADGARLLQESAAARAAGNDALANQKASESAEKYRQANYLVFAMASAPQAGQGGGTAGNNGKISQTFSADM